MTLSSIQLSKFRNVEHVLYSIDPVLTIIIGENARGKTNLLEAIFFLLTVKVSANQKSKNLFCGTMTLLLLNVF
jgi:DNA replication and repair protein RecF